MKSINNVEFGLEGGAVVMFECDGHIDVCHEDTGWTAITHVIEDVNGEDKQPLGEVRTSEIVFWKFGEYRIEPVEDEDVPR